MAPRCSASSSCFRPHLLGIALVVDDIHKGCNLAFRYPAPPSTSAMDHVASCFHKLSAPLLAKLFRPKNALCNQSFELVIDDLRFISHPVLVGSAQRTTTTTLCVSLASDAPKEKETTMFNIIFALDEQNTHQNDDPNKRNHRSEHMDLVLQRRKETIAAYRTVASQLANALLHEELRVGFVSKEVRELLHIRDELVTQQQQEQQQRMMANGNSSVSAPTSTSSLPPTNHSSTNSMPTGNTTTGRKDASGSSAPSASSDHFASSSSSSASSSTGNTMDVDPQTLIDVSLGKSVLANDLKRVFHGLDEDGSVHVVLNRWVKLSLTLMTPHHSMSMQSMVRNLRPYHTLLLLHDDEQKVKDALPVDHSLQLERLIEAANPLKSFQELALETSIPIHQIFRLASHLVYWGFARVIDTITMHNIYQVHPDADLRVQSAVAMQFRRKFAPHELCEVLASFSGSRRIGEYMKNLATKAKKLEYIHMLIWLLQHDFIIQLHRYVYFMIPPEAMDPHASSNELLMSTPNDDTPHQSLLSPSPYHHHQVLRRRLPSLTGPQHPLSFTDQEREYLNKIATTNPVFTLFKRLCVYFHGQYHLEEIMWRENVSRSELRTVLSTYQDIIVCCLHE